MPKPTVTMYVKRLDAAGYLKREIDNTDLRRHLLTLIDDGREVTAHSMSMIAEASASALCALARLNSRSCRSF
jgi:DNA-binding MarR family transcriptional regulator